MLVSVGCMGMDSPSTPDCPVVGQLSNHTANSTETMVTPNWVRSNQAPSHEKLRWARLLNGGSAAAAVVPAHDGGYVIKGTSFWVVHVDSDGETVWETRGMTQGTETGGHDPTITTAPSPDRCRDRPQSGRDRSWPAPTGERTSSDGAPVGEPGDPDDRYSFGNSIIRTPDGGYAIATGNTIAKLNSSGEVVWAHSLQGEPEEIAWVPGGDYIVAGTTETSEMDGWIARISPSGETKWERTFGGPKNDVLHALTRNGEGAVVAVGYTNSVGDQVPWAVKVETDGDGVWSRVIGTNPDAGWAEAIIPAVDGGYAVTGYRVDGLEDGFGLWKLSEDGDVRWGYIYGRGTGEALVPTRDGGYAIAGTGTADLRLVVTDRRGAFQGNISYGHPGFAYGQGIAPTGRDTFIVVGRYEEDFPQDPLVAEFERP